MATDTFIDSVKSNGQRTSYDSKDVRKSLEFPAVTTLPL